MEIANVEVLKCDQLFTALAAAQRNVLYPKKDARGQAGNQPTKYATLAECWQACREALSEQGLCVIQVPSADGQKVTVTTILGHKSGQQIAGSLTMTSSQPTPQALGSAITYARRYALCAMVGLAPEDDDGQAASREPERKVHKSEPKAGDRVQNPEPKPVERKPAQSVNGAVSLEPVLEKSIADANSKWVPGFLDAMTDVKELLGEQEYRALLRPHANKGELVKAGREEAKRVYRMMRDRLIEIKQEVA